VTTLFLSGSTAPTATSGVSTIATNFGGAVKIAACPNRIANVGPLADAGVPPSDSRGAGLVGVRGVIGLARLNLLLKCDDEEPVDGGPPREGRRKGVDVEAEERARTGLVRFRGPGENDEVLASTESRRASDCFSSVPSVHCKCKMTDLVAH
jgi:hypothetical protein